MAPSSTAGTSLSRSGCGQVIHVVNNARSPSASDGPASRWTNGSRTSGAMAHISSTERAAGRNPASASNGPSATRSSGLWLRSR